MSGCQPAAGEPLPLIGSPWRRFACLMTCPETAMGDQVPSRNTCKAKCKESARWDQQSVRFALLSPGVKLQTIRFKFSVLSPVGRVGFD